METRQPSRNIGVVIVFLTGVILSFGIMAWALWAVAS